MSPIKSTVGRSVGKLLNSFRDRDLSLNSSVRTGRYIFSATGGNQVLTPGNGYKYHTFTASGAFTVSGPPGTIEVLAVAGGGSGGTGYYGGGGGAGGLIYSPSFSISPGPYSVEVGGGGAAPNSDGGPSTFGTAADPSTHLVALGGGYGGPRTVPAQPGGSGGGVGLPGGAGSGIQPSDPTIPAISRTYGYGNQGGPDAYGAGGGGAGGVGQPGPDGDGGIGYVNAIFDGPLIGVPALNPYNGAFAGGGGGGLYPASPGVGGSGVGGDGGTGPSPDGKNAVANTGSGGGGGHANVSPGGNGSSGIVIIRYLTP